MPRAVDIELGPRRHHQNLVALLDLPILDSNIGDRSLIAIEVGIVNERSQGRLRISSWRWNSLDDRFQNLVYPDPRLGTDRNRIRRVDRHGRLNLLSRPLDVSMRQI